MKILRILLAVAVLTALIIGYFITYSTTVDRDDGRWRNAGEYGFIRYFNHDWQVYLFTPAAYCESWAIRFYPEKFLENTSWISTPMQLLIKGPSVEFLFEASLPEPPPVLKLKEANNPSPIKMPSPNPLQCQ